MLEALAHLLWLLMLIPLLVVILPCAVALTLVLLALKRWLR